MRIEGLNELQATMQDLQRFGERGLALAVVRAGLRVYAEQMRQEIKPQVQDVASEVGFRFDRRSGRNVASGRVGVGVGKPIQKRSVNRSTGGVGINSGNWHWWVLGSFRSGQRQTARGHNRGRLEAQQPNFAQRVKQRAAPKARAAMQAALNRAMARFSKSR
jgi:hypothetical protein